MSVDRTLVIPVAGTSTRFGATAGREVLKAIYREGPGGRTILGELLDAAPDLFGAVVVVGGYRFEELGRFLEARGDPRVTLVLNEHFQDWGSHYSMYLGLARARTRPGCREIVLAEGDLVLDRAAFRALAQAEGSVLSSNREPILASKSVAFYQNLAGAITFLYDPRHRALTIPEPFVAIANSGQVWKFADMEVLDALLAEQTEPDFRATNLNFIQRYFQALPPGRHQVLEFPTWHNCNTLDEYRRAFSCERES